MTLNILFIVLMLIFSAFFSSVETAFTSLSRLEVDSVSGRRGDMVRRLMEQPDRLLTTILIGNNLANIGAAAAVTVLVQTTFGTDAVSAASGALTMVILIFCEVTPKRLAIARDRQIVLIAAYPIYGLGIVLYPVAFMILTVSSLITRFFVGKGPVVASLEEILHAVRAGESAGIVKQYESRMIKGVFRLDDIPVKAVLTHRIDIFSLEKSEPIETVVDRVIERGFSRIPVHDRDDPEHIVGIVLAKDILKELAAGRPTTPVGDISKDPIFIPETHKINEVFGRFKNERLKMAIVLDEYGGLAGIVTLEDIAEEIFGDIYDETDLLYDDAVVKLKPRRYRVTGDATLPAVVDVLDISLPDGRVDQTIGAYVMERLGHVPRRNDVVTVPDGTLTVERVRRRRIMSVLLDLFEPMSSEESSGNETVTREVPDEAESDETDSRKDNT
jgi:putative hemolysin